MKLTVGGLFSGIGGFELGFERAGFEIKWMVEIDPFCRRVLAKHWPNVRRYEDVRTIEELERVDVICAGFPCQDISVAGRRAGLQGESSGLWTEVARVVGRDRPRYVLLENSPSLLVRGMGPLLGDLSGLGYDAEWFVIPAAAVGAPHLRARLWILAYPTRVGDRIPAPALCSGWDLTQHGAPWCAEPAIRRVADGVPARVERLRGLGNSIIPQIAQWIGERIQDAESKNA